MRCQRDLTNAIVARNPHSNIMIMEHSKTCIFITSNHQSRNILYFIHGSFCCFSFDIKWFGLPQQLFFSGSPFLLLVDMFLVINFRQSDEKVQFENVHINNLTNILILEVSSRRETRKKLTDMEENLFSFRYTLQTNTF